jgi:hypothetical protein
LEKAFGKVFLEYSRNIFNNIPLNDIFLPWTLRWTSGISVFIFRASTYKQLHYLVNTYQSSQTERVADPLN